MTRSSRAQIALIAQKPGVRDDVWDRNCLALCYRDPVLDDPDCGCRTDRRGSTRRQDNCKDLL